TQPRWQEVHHIIQARGCPSKVKVPIILVTDHRIECINRFIRECRGYSPESEIKHRSDNTVRGVFGHRFDDGSHNLTRVKGASVATHDHCQSGSRSFQASTCEFKNDLPT